MWGRLKELLVSRRRLVRAGTLASGCQRLGNKPRHALPLYRTFFYARFHARGKLLLAGIEGLWVDEERGISSLRRKLSILHSCRAEAW